MAQYLVSGKHIVDYDLGQLIEAIARATKAVPGTRVIRSDKDTGTAVLEVPEGSHRKLQEALGPDFFAEPNSQLDY